MALELRDPTTGKIKPVYLIAGGGIVIFGVVLLMGKGGDSSSQGGPMGTNPSGGGGVVSGGQSSDITQQLAELNDAIIGLAGGELPEAPGGSGSANVPANNSNTSPYYDDPNTYPVMPFDPYTTPIGVGPEVPLIPIQSPAPAPMPTPIKTITYTEQQALDAIKARAIAAGYSGSASSVQQTYQQDLAKGYTLEQIVKPASTTSTPAPTQAQLDAIKARAIAAGYNPTAQAILNTYYRYA